MTTSKVAVSRGMRPEPKASEPAPAWPVRPDAQSRHAAISSQLFTYSRYKSWAEKAKTAWDAETAEAEARR
jgi:hypothetical protein